MGRCIDGIKDQVLVWMVEKFVSKHTVDGGALSEMIPQKTFDNMCFIIGRYGSLPRVISIGIDVGGRWSEVSLCYVNCNKRLQQLFEDADRILQAYERRKSSYGVLFNDIQCVKVSVHNGEDPVLYVKKNTLYIKNISSPIHMYDSVQLSRYDMTVDPKDFNDIHDLVMGVMLCADTTCEDEGINGGVNFSDYSVNGRRGDNWEMLYSVRISIGDEEKSLAENHIKTVCVGLKRNTETGKLVIPCVEMKSAVKKILDYYKENAGRMTSDMVKGRIGYQYLEDDLITESKRALRYLGFYNNLYSDIIGSSYRKAINYDEDRFNGFKKAFEVAGITDIEDVVLKSMYGGPDGYVASVFDVARDFHMRVEDIRHCIKEALRKLRGFGSQRYALYGLNGATELALLEANRVDIVQRMLSLNLKVSEGSVERAIYLKEVVDPSYFDVVLQTQDYVLTEVGMSSGAARDMYVAVDVQTVGDFLLLSDEDVSGKLSEFIVGEESAQEFRWLYNSFKYEKGLVKFTKQEENHEG